MSTILIPCPTCSMTRTVTFEDRHAETRQNVCPTCAPYEDTHPGMVPARTGETRESSADPATGRCPDPIAGITTDPVLLEALKRAAAREMTPAERHAQRRSWLIGEMGIEHPEMSREQLEALADHAVGPSPLPRTSPQSTVEGADS